MAVSAMASRTWEREDTSNYENWWSSPTCRAYYNQAVCGEFVEGNSEGCRVMLRRALGGRKLERGVSIGSGAGTKEIAVLQDGLVESFDLWEISAFLAKEGSRNAAAAGVGSRIKYRLGDAFKEAPLNTYDLVHWDHSLHHMSDVDGALRWSVDAVRPGGFIYINDYIGPNRLQFTRREVDLANAFLAGVDFPTRFGYSTFISKLRQWWRDPSEAPQSERIADAIAKHMPGAQLVPIGGTLLNMLGGTIVPVAKGEDDPILQAFVAEDANLRAKGFSHFAFTLWQK